jgi:hypothetical protein
MDDKPDDPVASKVLEEAVRLASRHAGGTLATVHAEDATPYVSFVLFHLRPDGRLLFGSGNSPQHTRNMHATPEVSFLIDNREVIATDLDAFERIVIEGLVEPVPPDSPEYPGYLAELTAKHDYARVMTETGRMYCIQPRRLILMKGLRPERQLVNFEG